MGAMAEGRAYPANPSPDSDSGAQTRRLSSQNASASSHRTPPLLYDARAPHPDPLGWRLADTLAEWGACCDSLQQALVYLLLGGALLALLAKALLHWSWRCRRQ